MTTGSRVPLRAVWGAVLLVALLAPAMPAVSAAAPPQICARTQSALEAEQRQKVAAWIRRMPQASDLSVDYVCTVGRARAVIALSDFNGLESSVQVVDLAAPALEGYVLVDGAVEAPAIVTLPDGRPTLFYVDQEPERGLLKRRYSVVGLEEGSRPQVLYTGHYDPRRRGCAGLSGIDRVMTAAGAGFTDLNGDGVPDIVIDREETDCATGRTARTQDGFLATPQGWRRR